MIKLRSIIPFEFVSRILKRAARMSNSTRIGLVNRYRSVLNAVLKLSSLAVFFFVPWWLRPGWPWLPTPYYGGFLVTVPVLLAVGSWFLLGLPGLHESL